MTPEPQNNSKRDFVSIDDFSNEEIEAVFSAADKIFKDLKAWSHLCPGFILASLFHEPSTRTRLSFESSMLRLGGGVISMADPKSSSAVKGESLADTVRIVGGGYADIIVLRHPNEGAARHAAQYAPVPVVNAGDGGHEHPTQTLCDLYTLRKTKGKLKGQDVVLCGDLKHSRTVHSLAFALARFGANIICAPHPGLEMPTYVARRLRDQFHCDPHPATVKALQKLGPGLDAVYYTPDSPHQNALFPLNMPVNLKKIDALYVTRPQKERFKDAKDQSGYLKINRHVLESEEFQEAMVLHPLPRTEELSPDMDSDPRSLYFQQAALGVPIRMAILAMLLGKLPLGEKVSERGQGIPYRPKTGIVCANLNCISQVEKAYAPAKFRVFAGKPAIARCEYCEHELEVGWFATEGENAYRQAVPDLFEKIPAERWVLFEKESEAKAAGFHGVE